MSRLAVLLLAALVLCGTAGYAIAQSQSAPALKTCVKKKGGALRVASKCRKGERKVTLAQVGPAGAAGTAGTAGATGAAGTAGPSGGAGATGPVGPQGAPGPPGTAGADGSSSGETLYDDAGPAANFGTGPCVAAPSGGPTVTFTAPANALVQVSAMVTMQRTGTATSNDVCAFLDGAIIPTVLLHSTSMSPDTRYLSRANVTGVSDPYSAEPLVFPVSAGAHTITLRYTSNGGTSQFSGRRLWVTVLKPAT
jgi:hypothetical protein